MRLIASALAVLLFASAAIAAGPASTQGDELATLRAHVAELEREVARLKVKAGESATTQSAATKPATTKPAAKDLMALLGPMPKELWYKESETTAARERRDAWVQSNVVGRQLIFKTKLMNVSSTVLKLDPAHLNMWGREVSVFVYSDFPKPDIEGVSGLRVGDAIKAEGEVSECRVSRGANSVSITLKNAHVSR